MLLRLSHGYGSRPVLRPVDFNIAASAQPVAAAAVRQPATQPVATAAVVGTSAQPLSASTQRHRF